MRMKKKQLTTNVFVLAFIIWQWSEIINGSTIRYLPGMKYVRYVLVAVTVGLLVIRIAKKKYTIKRLVIIITISVFLLINDIRTGYDTYLPLWLFLVAIKENDFEITMKVLYRHLLVSMMLVISLRIIGIIEDKSDVFMITDFTRENFRRYALGFNHPNLFGMRLFELGVLHLYVNRLKLRIVDLIFYILILGIIYYVPNCQAATVCGLLVLPFAVYYKFKTKTSKRFLRIMQFGCTGIAMLCNLYSLIFGILGRETSNFVYMFDVWSSNRLKYAHLVYLKYGFSLFGKVVNIGRQAGTDVKYLDNGYIAILVKNGVFIYLMMSFLILFTIYKATKKDFLLGIILMVYAIDGLMTGNLWSTAINPFSIVAGIYAIEFFNKRVNPRKKKGLHISSI